MTTLPTGVYSQRKRLADGSFTTYYRWRATGKRIEGEPGTPEFEANLEKVKQQRREHGPKLDEDSFGALVRSYRNAPDFTRRKPHHRVAIERVLRLVEKWSPVPAKALRRRDLLEFRDVIAKESGPGAANDFTKILAKVFAFGVDREMLDRNPLRKVERIPGGTHETWTEAQIAYALAHLPELYRRVVVLALYTGQRVGDLCQMQWKHYDGSAIEVVEQQKTGAYAWIPAHRDLRRELDRWRADATSDYILTNHWGRNWPLNAQGHPSSLCTSMSLLFRKTYPALKGLVVHGLRKAAAVRLFEARATPQEIAAILGWKNLAMVELYTAKANRRRLALQGAQKLEEAGSFLVVAPENSGGTV